MRVVPHSTHVTVRNKFCAAATGATVWLAFCAWAAWQWFFELAHIGLFLSAFLILFIALVPGFINAFLFISLALDRRPPRKQPDVFPALSILIAAYNEEDNIRETLQSVEKQGYPAALEVIVINDGSRDATRDIVTAYAAQVPWLRLIDIAKNGGKAEALNQGLAAAAHPLVVTLDADTRLHRGALVNIVERYLADPPHTRAVAGTVMAGNARANWVTKMQEWDYFHGIAAIKRVQSMYHGTLVA